MQVDLNTSSIRPGESRAWLDALRQNILHNVQAAALLGVNMVAHTGSWEHDVAQVCRAALPRSITEYCAAF